MMSTKGRYGLRAMIDIARRADEGPVLAEEIAERRGIPRKYLEAILGTLRKGGLLRSLRGPGGGYVLARSARDISVEEILTVLEGPLLFAECTAFPEQCERARACVTRELWMGMTEAVSTYVRGRSLADLVEREKEKETEGGQS